MRFRDRRYLKAIRAQSLNDETGYVFVREKVHRLLGGKNSLVLHIIARKRERRLTSSSVSWG